MLKKLIFLSAVVTLFLTTATGTLASPEIQFADVTPNHAWAKEAINTLVEEGIINGIGDNLFDPDAHISREQFAKMLATAISADSAGSQVQSFVDVPADRWSFSYVESVKNHFPLYPRKSINRFDPEGAVVRQEVVTAIINAMGLGNASSVFNKNLLNTGYADADYVQPDLKNQVIVAIERGILRGTDGYIRPVDSVTRAEAAVLIHRMMLIRQGRGELYFTTSTPITGPAQVSVERAKEWAAERGAHQRFIDIADLYWKYGEITGIRPEALYAQAAKETGYGKYGGRVVPEQNNWAGIKTATATGDKTEDHETFATPEDGVRAHFNHMSAYIGLAPIGEPHGRYHIAKTTAWAGTVTTVEELGNKWAPEHTYGYSLVTKYMIPMMGN